MLQKVTEQDRRDGGTRLQSQALVTKSKGIYIHSAHLFARRHQMRWSSSWIWQAQSVQAQSRLWGRTADHRGPSEGSKSTVHPWGWDIRNLWPICQDLLLNSWVVWGSSKLCLEGWVIKCQQLPKTGAGEAILHLVSQEHLLRCKSA